MQNYSNKIFLLFFVLINTLVLIPDFAFADSQEIWKGAYTAKPFAGGALRNLYCDLVGEVEGSFGALVFITGGFVAFGMAVFGNAKRTYSIIIAGIVGATMSSGISLYFGKMCNLDSGGQTAKSFSVISSENSSIDKDVTDSDEALF